MCVLTLKIDLYGQLSQVRSASIFLLFIKTMQFTLRICSLLTLLFDFIEKGYDLMGFELSKPRLRSELEADLKR